MTKKNVGFLFAIALALGITTGFYGGSEAQARANNLCGSATPKGTLCCTPSGKCLIAVGDNLFQTSNPSNSAGQICACGSSN